MVRFRVIVRVRTTVSVRARAKARTRVIFMVRIRIRVMVRARAKVMVRGRFTDRPGLCLMKRLCLGLVLGLGHEKGQMWDRGQGRLDWI
jgi:hypothetical protein